MPNPTSSRENSPKLDRRAARHRATKVEIVAAAWELASANGLGGISMRDLGDRVGMKAQSIYSYFGSKLDIYDAMFHQGYLAFAEAMAETAGGGDSDLVEYARKMARRFFEFCTSDPVRYQLLFQRTVPDFAPSDESFAVAVDYYESISAKFADCGVTDPAAIDLWTAVLTGLTSQQISNDPGGDRWEQLIDPAVEMVLTQIAPHLFDTTKGPTQ